jgi:hypothetical protein
MWLRSEEYSESDSGRVRVTLFFTYHSLYRSILREIDHIRTITKFSFLILFVGPAA